MKERVAVKAEPNDADDFDVTEAALKRALREREKRASRRRSAPEKPE